MTSRKNSSSSTMLRPAGKTDLVAINTLIERAVNTWNLPERVKRLAMPSYLYNAFDLQHLHIVLAEDDSGSVTGVAAWEDASVRDCPQGKRGLLLHGIYVDSVHQGRGTGATLLSAAAAAAKENGYDGLLVKAQADAEGFFRSQGMQALEVADASRDYVHRYWLDTRQHAAGEML